MQNLKSLVNAEPVQEQDAKPEEEEAQPVVEETEEATEEKGISALNKYSLYIRSNWSLDINL